MPRLVRHASSSPSSLSRPLVTTHDSSPRAVPLRRPPAAIRLLTRVLPVLAVLLSVTTLILFHLHHSHLHLDAEEGDFNGVGGGAPNVGSVGGVALRHRQGLLAYLTGRYDDARAERAKAEAGDMGWKGGSEEAFVQMVREEEHQAQQQPRVVVVADVQRHGLTPEEVARGLSLEETATEGEVRNRPGSHSSPPKHMQSLVSLRNWSHWNIPLPQPPLPPRERTSRGYSGLPPSVPKPPALKGALRGLLQCPEMDDLGDEGEFGAALSSTMAYWNEPRGTRDLEEGERGSSNHPFLPPAVKNEEEDRARRRYLTFEPDTGGFNNLRMSLENLIVLAAATGRTLVMPPEQNMYLIEPKKGDRQTRTYLDFFNLTSNPELLRRVPIISSAEFLRREGGDDDGCVSMNGYNETYREHLSTIATGCENRKKSDVFCDHLYDHFREKGKLAPVSAEPPNENCFIFDRDVFERSSSGDINGNDWTDVNADVNATMDSLPDDVRTRTDKFCGERTPLFYSRDMHDAPLWHFETLDFRYRLLIHFYALLHFTDPRVGNYYKRFVRDFVRYHDVVLCTAGKIVLALQEEGRRRGMRTDEEGAGGFSSLHVRRGDLQFHEVKFDSDTWYNNTKEVWFADEVLYVATDERNKTFFNGLQKHHDLRFLDDYKELVGLDNIDPTLYGMIDIAVASRGRAFAGTWFSTFSGYIVRLRGYYGLSKFSTYYSYLPRKYFMHDWADVGPSYYAREYPTGWTGIDGDVFVDEDFEGEGDRKIALGRDEAMQMMAGGNEDANGVVTGGGEVSRATGLARGISGLPMSSTPALQGAQRGRIECGNVDVDALAFWNDPQGTRDDGFQSPFRDQTKGDDGGEKTKYLTFELDVGGFNNVRMSFEIVFVMAAAMGRTLVLPPDQAIYRLRNDARKERGFGDFFPFHSESFQKRVKVISMDEFIKLEGRPEGQFPMSSSDEVDKYLKFSKTCTKMSTCKDMSRYIESVGVVPNITSSHECLVFDEGMYQNGIPDNQRSIEEFCASGNRKLVYVTKEMQEPPLLFVKAGTKGSRMLSHFYGYLYFTDPSVSNYFKRYVRDLLHYRDEIFCAAGKIVAALQAEGKQRGFDALDTEGGGGYSSLHVRRGELQYKKVKISAEEWYANTRDVWKEGEVLYIATDEKNKSFFDPFRAKHALFFLDDFRELVGLDDMDPNHMGMIDTIVASRGRAFAGTFRSTFSGYINRIRGYYGMSMKDSYYGTLDHKKSMHEWHNVNLDTYAKEWPDGWMGIDGDVVPSEEIF